MFLAEIGRWQELAKYSGVNPVSLEATGRRRRESGFLPAEPCVPAEAQV